VSDSPVRRDIDGFLLLDKPQGLTSQQGVTRAKRALGVRKAGHAGTLDPMATGLLVIGLGKATRLLGHLSDKDKQYEATIRLGGCTTTDDAEGEPVGEPRDATGLKTEAILTAMSHYVGEIQQVPSSVSAIKVDGKRAYALVRAGEEVTLKPRTVTVTRYDLLGRRDNDPWVDLDVIVDCSSGTYIRALARDLGEDLGMGGHLIALRRTRVGRLSVDDAVDLDDVSPDRVMDMGSVAELVAPRIEVPEEWVADIAVGRRLLLHLAEDLVTVFSGGDLLALYKPDPADPALARPVAVFISPDDCATTVTNGDDGSEDGI